MIPVVRRFWGTQSDLCVFYRSKTIIRKSKFTTKPLTLLLAGKSGSWRSKFTVEQNDICDAYLTENRKDMPDLQLEY